MDEDDGPGARGGRARSIGAMSRASGLSVSALRFYDSAGVLRPDRVDSSTGYRWYAAEQVDQARVIAALRRVRMPIADICAVLTAGHADGAAAQLLDRHLRRLEDGLADARVQIRLVHEMLDTTLEKPMTCLTVCRTDLSAALRSVRHAVSDDPDLPALSGVLFDFDGTVLRLVATDRYRLAMAVVPTRDHDGPAAQVIAPSTVLDGSGSAPDAEVTVLLNADAITVAGVRTASIDAAYPDFRRLLRTDFTRQVTIATADLRERLASGPTRTRRQQPGDTEHQVSALRFHDATIEVIDDDQPGAVGVNREFLLQALDAGRQGQLVLGLDGLLEPLAILDPERPGDISLVMPTQLSPTGDRLAG